MVVTEAPSVDRATEFVSNSISNLYTKCLFKKSSQESVRYTSVALCAVGTSVTLCYLCTLCDSVCLICKSYSLSLHISEDLFSYSSSFIFVIILCFILSSCNVLPVFGCFSSLIALHCDTDCFYNMKK